MSNFQETAVKLNIISPVVSKSDIQSKWLAKLFNDVLYLIIDETQIGVSSIE